MSFPPPVRAATVVNESGGGGRNPNSSEPDLFVSASKPPAGKGRAKKGKRAQKDASSSSSSSSSSRQQHGGIRLRNKSRSPLAIRAYRDDGGFQDLALPLGMSFAAVVSQVLDEKCLSRDKIPIDRLLKICSLAVKESVRNIYGDRFDRFTSNFEKSFGSTLRTLRIINEASIGEEGIKSIDEISDGQGNSACDSFLSGTFEAASIFGAPESFDSTLRTLRVINEASIGEHGIKSVDETSDGQGNSTCDSFLSGTFEAASTTFRASESSSDIEEFQGSFPVNSLNNQLIIHGQINQQLANVSRSTATPAFNQSLLNTFEKSVMEQTRSNDLKSVEISLVMKRLQLKQSQLALNSYANLLERIKISMGFSKASFKEKKLRNQMQDLRNAELVKRCIDLLVAGLVIMMGFLAYGAYIHSYERIIEATSSCTSTPKESRSWWIPKPVSSFSSGWAMLRCHVQVISRMAFGFFMILAIAYSVFQRSSVSSPTMPVTFIILLLGFACGVAGKLCVDTLGGNGYQWLLYWEALCLLHFIANVFPSLLYTVLYGPVTVSHGPRVIGVPYWIRRCTFYSITLLILPTLAALLPFASLQDWKQHAADKLWSLGNENGH